LTIPLGGAGKQVGILPYFRTKIKKKANKKNSPQRGIGHEGTKARRKINHEWTRVDTDLFLPRKGTKNTNRLKKFKDTD